MGRRMPIGQPDRLGDAGDVEKKVARLQDGLGDPTVKSVDDVPAVPVSARSKDPNSPSGGAAMVCRMHNAPLFWEMADRIESRRPIAPSTESNGSLHVAWSGLKREAAMVEDDKDGVRPCLVECRVRLQRVLQEMIVGARDVFERKAMARCRCDQDRNDEIERAVSDQAQSEWSQWLQGVSLLAG